MRFNSNVPAAAALLLVTLATTGCSTNSVGLSYKPTSSPAAVSSQTSKVSIGSFTDQRGETATWIGAIRGGFGQPLKTIEVTPSVAVVVQSAFSEGVKARGLQAAGNGGAYQISGVIQKLDCSQYVRREAHAAIEVRVIETATGRQVFTQTYTVDELEGSVVALNVGIFGSVDSLRALAERALSEVVDKALDDSALQNSMRSPRA